MAKNKTFWPYGILISIALIILACVATIIFSLDYPVHMDNFCLDKYQNVDNNYNKIQISQKKFEEKYSVKFIPEIVDQNVDFSPKISIISDQNLSNLSAKILLTRPDTNEFDQNLQSKFDKNFLEISPFKLIKPGRWQIFLRISDQENAACYKFEFFAKK